MFSTKKAPLNSQYFTEKGLHVLCFWKPGEFPRKESLITLITTVNPWTLRCKNEECKGEYFFYGKLSTFDIYFSKTYQMLKITSERGTQNISR